MDVFFLYITWLGSIIILFPAAVTIIGGFWRMLPPSDMFLLLGGVLGASLSAHVLKMIISRPRPLAVQDMIVNMPTDFSFPSAHTAQATAFFVSLALITTRGLPWKTSVVVWSLCGLVICTVGFSRIYLKVHYVSDVIAGAALGLVWVFALQWFIHALFTGGGHA